MGDVLEIVEIQNSQLSCEEKSPQDILLALQTNQQLLSTNSPTANHAQEKIILEAKDAGDAISCRKEESPPLSSPQQPKAQPFTKDDESLLNENVPHSENISAATAISQNVESQLMVMKPKENVAPAGSQLNVNETLASNEKDNPHTPSETDIDEETDDPSTGTNASSQVVRSESRRFFQQAPELYYVTEEIDDNSTELLHPQGKIESSGDLNLATIHKQKAACRQCDRLVTEDIGVLNVKCECTETSLIHQDCMDAWSQQKGDKCLHCDAHIKTKNATVSSIPPQTTLQNPPLSTCTTCSWCCFTCVW